MNTNRNVLGKGLAALIPEAQESKNNYWGATVSLPTGEETVVQVPVERVSANPYQPRSVIDDERLTELASSIREHGIIQPLIVTRKDDGSFELIAGERRLRAAKQIGLATVPVIVRKAEDQKKLEFSIIENVQRHNLNPLEEALGYRRLIDEFSLTQEDVAQRVGKSRSSVANFLRLLALPRPVLQALEREQITFSHAKVILSYPAAKEQLAMLKKILRGQLTVHEATRVATKEFGRRPPQDPVLASWEHQLSVRLGFDTKIVKRGEGGLLEISFFSDEDLKTLIDRITGVQ